MKTSLTQVFACVAVLMLISQASALAYTFSNGERVEATASNPPLNVRATHSTSGTIITTEAEGNFGTIASTSYYDGTYTWWYINWDNGYSGYSVDAYLEPSPTLAVTSPNGGENWTAGSIHTVTWKATGDTSAINYQLVAYSTDGGSTFTTVSSALTPSTRSYSWTLPSISSTSVKVRVRALDVSTYILASDTSDNYFTIGSVTTYSISVSALPSAGGSVGGGGTFASGSSQTVTASANSGYTFANWTENGSVVSSSANYTFTVSANRTLVANFTQIGNYTISLSASPSAGGTVSGSGTFVSGSSRTVTASANSGYTFANWTENGGVVSSSSSYTFTLTANRTLVANFTTSGTLLGTDFNADGGSINWSQEISISPNFMVIKAAQGGNANSFLPSDISSMPAISSSFTIGFYDYADPDEVYGNEVSSTTVTDPSNSGQVIADAQAAANSFYQNARSYLKTGYLVPALDLEDEGGYGGFNSPYDSISGYPKWTWSEMAEWIAAWTAQLQQDAPSLPAPILYMTQGYAQNISPQLINSYLSSPISYHLWVADINDSPNIDPSPSIGSWPTWAIEQYDWTGADYDALNSSTTLNSLEIQTVTQTATISVVASPSNGGTVSGGGNYTVGSSQQISATANSGWTFTGWSDGGAQTHNVTVPAGGATYTANFQQQSATITVAANPPNGGTVSGSGNYAVGSSQQISATANSGWTFMSWSDGGAQTHNVTVAAGGATLMANFVNNPIISNPSRTGTTFTISVPTTQVGFNYTLEYKNSFSDANWTTGQTLGGTGGTITLTDTTATGSSRLYHVRVQ